jgi:hypothetical protein
MKKKIGFAIILALLSGCAFKGGNDQSSNTVSTGSKRYTGFIPQDLKVSDAGKAFTLIDVLELAPSDYNIDTTKLAKGQVEYPFDYPIFTDNQCQGLGYNISYEGRRRAVTSNFKLVLYVNKRPTAQDHLVASKTDSVQVAVYGEYAPLSDFVDAGNLPNEFVKTMQPSNKCHYMCPEARVTPTRPLIFVPGRINCLFWIWGADANQMPTSQQTDDFFFDPRQFEVAGNRENYIQQITACDAVRSNSDLESYYKAATDGGCAYNSIKTMMREWYFVEQKIPYKPPVYSISNFTEIVKDTANTQGNVVDRPVHLTKDWIE